MYAFVSGIRFPITSAHRSGSWRLSNFARVRQARLRPVSSSLSRMSSEGGASQCTILDRWRHRSPSLGRMSASARGQFLPAMLRRAERDLGQSCLHKTLPGLWQHREYGLPVRIGQPGREREPARRRIASLIGVRSVRIFVQASGHFQESVYIVLGEFVASRPHIRDKTF